VNHCLQTTKCTSVQMGKGGGGGGSVRHDF
jgi:hypothetical protein